MFYVGYFFGALSSGLLLSCGFYFSQFSSTQESPKPKPSMPAFLRRHQQQKKKPKALSEYELWEREQEKR
jgi:hypothetical protein